MIPEERALAVYDAALGMPQKFYDTAPIIGMIAQALRDHGNEKVEKAAVIAETSDDFRSATGRRIRALKDTPQDKPEAG